MCSMKDVALIIRKVPDEVRRDLKVRAALEGKSMQQLMLEIIKKEMEKTNEHQTVLV